MADQYQDVNAVSAYSPPVLIGVGATLTVLPVLVVGLRFYARHHYRIGYGWDDWTILIALVLCIGGGIDEILSAVIGGLGSHQELGPNGELIHTQTLYNYEKLRYANLIITTLNLGVVKVSILLFYRRLFVIKDFRTASTAMIGLVTAWTIAFTVTMVVQCIPISDFWNLFEMEYPQSCVQVQLVYKALAWSDMMLDIICLALPIPFVCVLHMPWRKKIAVIDILLLGIVVLGSGIARLVSFIEVINETGRNPQGYYHDTPWWTAGPLFWHFAANSIAIIGACLPTLAPLWTRSAGMLASSMRGSIRGSIRKESTKSEPDRIKQDPESTSISKLVGFTPMSHVSAERVSAEEFPESGIHVSRSFSVDRV